MKLRWFEIVHHTVVVVFQLKERLRKGGQSSVYLVEHIKEDNKQFVLKKVKDKF